MTDLSKSLRERLKADGFAPPAKVVDAWHDRNRRSLDRVAQLMTELRAAPAPDAAMLSVALRELRNLV